MPEKAMQVRTNVVAILRVRYRSISAVPKDVLQFLMLHYGLMPGLHPHSWTTKISSCEYTHHSHCSHRRRRMYSCDLKIRIARWVPICQLRTRPAWQPWRKRKFQHWCILEMESMGTTTKENWPNLYCLGGGPVTISTSSSSSGPLAIRPVIGWKEERRDPLKERENMHANFELTVKLFFHLLRGPPRWCPRACREVVGRVGNGRGVVGVVGQLTARKKGRKSLNVSAWIACLHDWATARDSRTYAPGFSADFFCYLGKEREKLSEKRCERQFCRSHPLAVALALNVPWPSSVMKLGNPAMTSGGCQKILSLSLDLFFFLF